MHSIEEVLDIIIKSKYKYFFAANAADEYWAIIIRKDNEYKTGIITPHEQFLYLRID